MPAAEPAPVPDDDELSAHSRHAIALVRLQGYEPDDEDLQDFADLDAGRITPEEAIARLDARYKHGQAS